MKIRFKDRMILFFGGLMTIAAGFFLIAAGLQLQGAMEELLPFWARVVCIICGVLTAAFGAYVIVFPHRRPNRRQDFVVQKADHGELRIAVTAIESQVKKCIDLHEEIRLVSMDIMNPRSGVIVDLRIALANNISIPLAVASLQKQIKQYLSASSGIEVKEVRVSVEATEDGLEPKSSAHGDAAALPEEEIAAPVKQPLHRRLFSKANQPAILPEPPKETKDEMAAWRPPETEFAQEKPEPETDAPQDADALNPLPGSENTAPTENTQPDEEMEDHSHE